ncbi:dnaJ homolog subfamily C member 22 isoform X4 [Synchiropus splendidus]|uniref:dnaJ homolog subfamily C member 22 isoform X4 n=1 Tax=Synchiropus splendidus TaxID=270530 RepID=UPI00237DD518|nr:dnaJ homolog subfamily C member 22 isoform X4 [Synchiropus splendidus]
MKSLLVAYVLWALGGPLGLQHLYLRRDSHALLWMLTLGGFGVGWLRDALRLPAYVSQANGSGPDRPPSVGPVRFVGQVCVGMYFGSVALMGLGSLRFFDLMVLPLSVGAGVHLVSTVGQQTSDLQKTLIACLITSPIFYGSTLSPLPISLAAAVTAARHCRVKRAPATSQRLGPRLYRLALAWLAFSAPLAYCVFHNTTATLHCLSECLAALLDAFWFLPWLKGMTEHVLLIPYRILSVLTGGGYYPEAWRKVLELLLRQYSHRELEALQVLSLDADATLEEISRSYRELAKTWHPDHNPSLQAEAMFVKLHDAYQILVRRHRARSFN